MVIVFSGVMVFWAMKEDAIHYQAFLAGDTLSWIFSGHKVHMGEERVPNPTEHNLLTTHFPTWPHWTYQSRRLCMQFGFCLQWSEIWPLHSCILFTISWKSVNGNGMLIFRLLRVVLAAIQPDQILGSYTLYLDTLYLDTIFNVTDMYLDTFVNFSI